MAEPCKQEGPIAAIKADNHNLATALMEIREGQREFILILKDISQQSEQIKTLFQRVGKSDEDINIIYARVRELELAPGKQATATQIYGINAVIAAGIAWAFKKFGG